MRIAVASGLFPLYEVFGGDNANVYLEALDITEIGGSGYMDFDWPKPTKDPPERSSSWRSPERKKGSGDQDTT